MRAELEQARYTFLRVSHVAEVLATSEGHVRDLIRGGEFTFPGTKAPVNVGRAGSGRIEYRIPPEALEAFLAAREVGEAAA